MKIKTKLVKCKDGSYRVKVSHSNGRRRIISFYSAQELGVSSAELPCIDFRSKILERMEK
jgi:hypothetical protein